MTTEQQKLLTKAQENVHAAKILLSQGFKDIAVSRTYYAMFYLNQTISTEQAQEQISRAERFLELGDRLII